MMRLLTGYVGYFNRRYNRHGHLLQNRYKSIVCQEEVYLKELVRYIHLNPLRAGIVPDLEGLNHYRYCGHSVLMGQTKVPWQDVAFIFHSFGKSVRRARREYLSYVESGVAQGRRQDLIGGGLIRSLGGWAEVKKLRGKGQDHIKSDERILGGSDFVDSVLGMANERCKRECELRRRGYDMLRVSERVAEVYQIKVKDIFAKGRQQERVNARSLFCFWSARGLGIPLAELARKLGMSIPGVGYAVRRGESICIANDFHLVN